MDKKNISDIYKLTPIQEGMLFHTLRHPHSGVYVEQFTQRIARPDAALLEQAFAVVFNQNSILKTGFFWEGLDRPVQVVLKDVDTSVEELDWSDLAESVQNDKLRHFLDTDKLTPFNLNRAPLMRQRLVHLSESESYFVWTYHHILLDGWSAFMIIDQLFSTYAALEAQQPVSLPPPVPYKNYVRWLQQQDKEQEQQFWSEYLSGFHATTPLGLVENPLYDANLQADDYDIVVHELPSSLADTLRTASKSTRLTLNTFFTAAWSYLLAIYSGEDDIVFGTTVAGRPTDLQGSQAMVGLFINTLPSRIQLNPALTILEWLKQLQSSQLQVRNYEHSSLVDVQSWSQLDSGTALFDSMLAVESFPSSRHVTLSEVKVSQKTNYALTLVVEPGARMRMKAMFNPSRFPTRAIVRLLKQFEQVLNTFAEKPEQVVGDISLVSAQDEQVLDSWNSGHLPIPPEATMASLFLQQAQTHARRIAIVTGAGSSDRREQMTYQELEQQSRTLACQLIQSGIGPGEQVGMLLQPSLEMIVAIVAIVRAGGAYAPLDPGTPAGRINGMIADLGMHRLITHRQLAADIETDSLIVIDLDKPIATVSEAEADRLAIDVLPAGNPLFYTIHTSGSTGKPKAAGVYHQSYVDFILWWTQEFGFSPQDRMLLVNKVTFDLSQKNIWGALLTGGEVHLNVEPHFNPVTVAELIERHKITWMNCTPSMAYALAESQLGESDVEQSPAQSLERSMEQSLEQSDVDKLQTTDSARSIYQRLNSLRYLFLGGEPVDKSRLADWMLSPDFQGELVNTYGPTECTDLCCTHRFTADEFTRLNLPVTVGTALPNLQVHVLDRHNNRLPEGIIGEVVIGGSSIGVGYLNNAAMTAEKFIPNPLNGIAGSHLYRTGDLGYFREDGTVIVRGRVDFQVKIRGYRVELGEIDSALRTHTTVADAVTVVDQNNNQQLIAYVVLQNTAASEQEESAVGQTGHMEASDKSRQCQKNTDQSSRHTLKAHLQALLPDYMVPSVYVVLDTIPLNANGKVDRSALPKPADDDRIFGRESLQPRNSVEEKLCEIWKKILQQDTIGVTDNFFERGGHSLSITQVYSRIVKTMNVDLSLSDLFERPTIEQQAQLIAELEQANGNKAETDGQMTLEALASRPASIPLSFSQGRLWFLHQYDPQNLAYNVPNAIHLQGDIRAEKIQQVLELLTWRHESLRTYFPNVDGQPQQRVEAAVTASLRVLSISQLDMQEQQTELAKAATEEARYAFDLQAKPPVRYLLVQVDNAQAVLFVTMHHIITDGWSMDIFTRELQQLHGYLSSQENAQRLMPEKNTVEFNTWASQTCDVLPQLPVQFADYSIWQRQVLAGERLDKELAYWRRQLQGSSNTIKLPYDYARGDTLSTSGGMVVQSLSRDLLIPLKKISEQQGTTLFITLLAVFQTFIYRLSEQTDFNIGTPIANRHHQEIENVIGFFVNTLVLRSKIAAQNSFIELLQAVKTTAHQAYDHQEIPFELLVEKLQPERSAAHNPFFQVLFALQNAYENTDLIDSEQWVSRFDLQVTFTETSDGLKGSWEFNSDLFRRETIQRMSEQFSLLLHRVLANPHLPVDQFSLAGADDIQNELYRWNETRTSYPRMASIATLFEQQVQLAPAAIALVSDGRRVSYQQLNEKANRLAHLLIKQGARPHHRIGMSLYRGVDLTVAILAVIKAGCTYVPLDPDYPRDRLAYMAKDSQIHLLLTSRHMLSLFSETHQTEKSGGYSAQQKHPVSDDTSLQIIWDGSLNCLLLDTKATHQLLAQQPDTNPAAFGEHDARFSSENTLAYMVYTSGTTGKPKGVMVPHRAVIRLVRGNHFCPLNPETVMLQIAPVAFDASTFEIWGALLNGGTLVTYTDTVVDFPVLTTLIDRENINTAFMSAGLFNQWVLQLEKGPTGFRYLMAGGDVVPVPAVKKLYELDSDVILINGYGPTESTTFICTHEIPRDLPDGESIPIGKPVSNTTAYILDGNLEPVPAGSEGELYAGGDGLALGYNQNPQATAEKFVPNPFVSDAGVNGGALLYRTGDRVKRLPDGSIAFLGRVDHQVKIRGFRIEPAEVQALISQHSAIEDACVTVIEDTVLGKQLAAYYVVTENRTISTEKLRQYLNSQLPDYMIPGYYLEMDALPLNANGKVDRSQLPEPAPPENETAASSAPESDLEREVWAIWCELLQREGISLDDDFFRLGGHSLLATQVVAKLRAVLGVHIPLKDFFADPTIRGLCRYMKVAGWAQEKATQNTTAHSSSRPDSTGEHADTSTAKNQSEPSEEVGCL